MVVPGDIRPAGDRCEICGIELGGEIVIQEFADGSLARLCPECAAGAALDDRHHEVSHHEVDHHEVSHPAAAEPHHSIWPDEEGAFPEPDLADPDPLERTRELLMPVADLIALQGEMQGALERLASSLERFAADILTESQGKTAVESRLHMLVRELDKTRAQLQKTEFLVETAAPEPAPPTAEVAPVPAGGKTDSLDFTIDPLPAQMSENDEPVATGIVAAQPLWVAPPTEPVTPAISVDDASFFDDVVASLDAAASSVSASPAAPESPLADAAAGSAPSAGAEEEQTTSFRIEEVQSAQRYYNESPFINRIRDVRRSLGRPKANLTRVPGVEPRAIVTIAWDIVWYQYLIDLRRDLPAGYERVVLHREGMDLSELAHSFNDKNAVVNDDGRLDASELEVRLLSDPSALISEMSEDEKKLLEDATEEIWDQHVAPEFKWDD
jgi:hypothetical protein